MASFRVIKQGVIKPSAPPAEPPETVELLGVDMVTNHWNMKSTYFFPSVLNARYLKKSLAEVLSACPILAARVRQKKNKVWAVCDGSGVQVVEQRCMITGGPSAVQSIIKDHSESFVHGPRASGVNSSTAALLYITLTELEYVESTSLWSCRPAACASACVSSTANDGTAAAATPGCAGGMGVPPVDGDGSRMPVIKYAVGVCMSHTIADGNSIAQFVMGWALASARMPVPRPVYSRKIMLDAVDALSAALSNGDSAASSSEEEKVERMRGEGDVQEWKEEEDMHPHYKNLGWFGASRMMSTFMTAKYYYETVRVTFSSRELKAIKAAAMAPLEGTGEWVSSSNALAAHLWPLLCQAWFGRKWAKKLRQSDSQTMGNGDTHQRQPLPAFWTAVNLRKALKMPPNYFGNCALFQGGMVGYVDESLSQLALKIRRASSGADVKGAVDELRFVDRMQNKGTLPNMFPVAMHEALKGRPKYMWDDVSGFWPSTSPAQPLGLCGAPIVQIDFPMIGLPGFVLVLPSPEPDGSAGKDVIFAVKKNRMSRVLDTEFQLQLHRYATVVDIAAAAIDALEVQ